MAEKSEKSAASLRNVFALGIVSFFTDISSEMVFSVLPAFILGLSGGSQAVLGLIEGIAEALSYSLRSISGIFSDKFRRRKVIVLIGYAVSNTIKPLFYVAQTIIETAIIRICDRVGKAIRASPRDALISESVPEKRMGAVFGLHRTLDQLGAILGPVLASSLMLFLGFTMRDIFWISFIPGSIALIVLIIFVKEKVATTSGEIRILQGMKMVLKGRFPLLLLRVGIFSLGAFNFSVILSQAENIGMVEALIPMVYAIINLAHTAIAIPAGILSDRIGREKVLIMGYIAFLTSALLLSAPYANPLYIFLIALVYGVYVGIVETIQRAIVPRYASTELKGTAYGLYYLTVGSAFFIANATFGSLWQYIGPIAAVSYSGVTSITAIIGMIVFLKRERIAPLTADLVKKEDH